MSNPAMCQVCHQGFEREIHADKRILLMDAQGGQVSLPVTLIICKKCGAIVIKKRADMQATPVVTAPTAAVVVDEPVMPAPPVDGPQE